MSTHDIHSATSTPPVAGVSEPPRIDAAADPLAGTAFHPSSPKSGPSKAVVGGLSFVAGLGVGLGVGGVVVVRQRSHRLRNRVLLAAARRAPTVAKHTGRTALKTSSRALKTGNKVRKARKGLKR